MSSRALRKLGKGSSLEDDLAKYTKREEESSAETESSDEEQVLQPNRANAFAFFNNDEESEEDDTSEESDNDVSEAVKTQPKMAKSTAPTKKNNTSDKKKKMHVDEIDDDELDKILEQVKIDDKKRKPKISVKSDESGSDSDIFYSDYDSDYDPNDLDDDAGDDNDHVDSLPWPIYTLGGKLLTVKKFEKCHHLLKVNPKDFDPDREYENLFGKLSTAAIDDANSTSSTAITPEMLETIQKLAKRVRGWSGRDHKSIPGTSRKLKLTKIRNDWIPIPKKPLSLDEMSKTDLLDLYTSKFKEDWKNILIDDIKVESNNGIKYYTVNPGPSFSYPAITEFFLSVVVQPDHDSLIRLLQKSPYSIETLLQVACIIQRQGDNSNTNGLIERALFLFDWSFPNSFTLGDGKSRLPFEYFFNRQMYLTLFRYITVLTQKSTFFTALSYCKLLLSFNPTDDPYSVRYFIDFYAFSSGEYQYLIDFIDSPLGTCYEEWLTGPLLYTKSLCYFKLGKIDDAKEALKIAYMKHPYTGHEILQKLGDLSHPWLLSEVNDTVKLITSIYLVRLDILVEEPQLKNFFLQELSKIIETIGKPNMSAYYWNNLEEIPENIIRYAILSNESTIMAKIPESIWSSHDIYEFDILPPKLGTSIYNYIDDNQVSNNVMQNSMQTEEIRQLQDLLQQTINEA